MWILLDGEPGASGSFAAPMLLTLAHTAPGVLDDVARGSGHRVPRFCFPFFGILLEFFVNIGGRFFEGRFISDWILGSRARLK